MVKSSAIQRLESRWIIHSDGGGHLEILTLKKVQVLEFVAIQRKDTGAWAIPGGMVDPGEKVLFLMSIFDHRIQLFCRLIS